MVSALRGRRGGSSFGCLVMVLLLAGVVYYGLPVAEIYFRYYQLQEAMKSEARLAPGISDDVIRRRLIAQADTLLGNPPVFTITRAGRPARIIIETRYSEQVTRPFFKRTFVLKPRAEAPL